MPDKEYNGHRNWAAWNIALWISGDYGLYRAAIDAKRECGSARKAALLLIDTLPSHTPDGARYTVANLTAAIAGLE